MAAHHNGFSREIVQKHEHELDLLIEEGIFKPVFLYQLIFFNLLPLVGLIIPRSGPTKYVRPAVFVACLAFALEILQERRALLGGNGYMIGLMTAWWLIWVSSLYCFTDVEKEYRRIERVNTDQGKRRSTSSEAKSDGHNIPGVESDRPQDSTSEPEQFYWQAYPSKFTHRLEWCAGLVFNLRGPEWNWRAPRLAPLPRNVYKQLSSGFISKDMQQEKDVPQANTESGIKKAFRNFLLGYLALDALKTFMIRDPYFRGDISSNAEKPFPISLLVNIPFAIRFYHCFTTCLGVYAALIFVTALNPIFFRGLSLLFPNASRKLTGAPLDAPWLYADTFGPFFGPVLNDGLAGAWGQWWHQIFRHGFTTTARWILSIMPRKWSSNARVKRLTYIFVAFSLSGCIHASGSYTQFTETHPFKGPFLFFALQSAAVIAESVFKTVILPKTPLARSPIWLCRATNFIGVIAWLLFSGPLIADDFAAGGIWLMEPVPLSPLRGLGLANGQGWWCWQGVWFQHWSDGTYWGSGIRMI